MQRIVAIAAFLFCGYVQAQEQMKPFPPLELKGDRVGESLDEFKLRNPTAHCEKQSARVDQCVAYIGVTIADAPIVRDPGCASTVSGIDCLEGLTAIFHEQRLFSLTYTVDGAYRHQIALAIRKKYGAPLSESKARATWYDETAVLSVSVTTAKQNKREKPLVIVLLGSSHDDFDKDI